ncbi:hypothetical protein BH11MYX1_BH11MYX1_16030 [soil metagenome]
MNRFALLGVLMSVPACSSDPASVAGNYTVGVTNRTNGCNFASWTEGAMNSGIPVAITQAGSTASANITGVTGGYFDLVFGTSVFTGTVDGDALDLKLMGTKPQTTGNCTYTYDGEIVGTATGDTLTGKINYTAATNNHTDCATIEGCVTYQDFSGSRPPQ